MIGMVILDKHVITRVITLMSWSRENKFFLQTQNELIQP